MYEKRSSQAAHLKSPPLPSNRRLRRRDARTEELEEQDEERWKKKSPKKGRCYKFPKVLVEGFDTDQFVGVDEEAPKAGEMWTWAGNDLCEGLNSLGCKKPVGKAYGRAIYLDDEGTYDSVDYWVLDGYGTLVSMDAPVKVVGEGGIVGGTGCFAKASGIGESEVVEKEGEEPYYIYRLGKVVL